MPWALAPKACPRYGVPRWLTSSACVCSPIWPNRWAHTHTRLKSSYKNKGHSEHSRHRIDFFRRRKVGEKLPKIEKKLSKISEKSPNLAQKSAMSGAKITDFRLGKITENCHSVAISSNFSVRHTYTKIGEQAEIGDTKIVKISQIHTGFGHFSPSFFVPIFPLICKSAHWHAISISPNRARLRPHCAVPLRPEFIQYWGVSHASVEMIRWL